MFILQAIQELKDNKEQVSCFISKNDSIDNIIEFFTLVAESKTLKSLKLEGDFKLKVFFDENNYEIYSMTETLIEALKFNTSIINLDLSREFNDSKCLSEKDIVKLCDFLRNNTTIKAVHLQYNKLSDLCAYEIAEMLKVNKSLLALELSHNSISHKGAEKLAIALAENKSLIYFILSENNITDEGFKHLINAMKTNNCLEQLKLDNCNLTSEYLEEFLEVIKDNKSLKELDLSNNALYNYGIKILTLNSNLKKLALCNTGINDSGVFQAMINLSDNPSLEELSIAFNDITSLAYINVREGLKRFKNIKTEITLEYSWEKNENISAEDLEEIKNLIDINKSIYNSISQVAENFIEVQDNFRKIVSKKRKREELNNNIDDDFTQPPSKKSKTSHEKW